jgi:fatty acid desaturase
MSESEDGRDNTQTTRRSVYAVLLRQIKQYGLLDRRTRWYVQMIAVIGVLLAAGWIAFVIIGDSWWQLALAVFFALVFAQVGFLAHDAGHQQIFTSRRANDITGVLCADLAVGISYAWWVDDHNRHHAHPNQEGKDTGINFPALAFTAGQARDRGRLARFICRYQAYFFFPLLLLAALNLHLKSVVDLAGRKTRARCWEWMLFTIHFAGYFGLLFWVLSPVRAVAFILVHQGLFGLYLGSSVAPNHKGMALLDADDARDFLHRQVETSRNVRGGWLMDHVFGGLNYQIEHHLFPSMPRPNLRRSQPIVREFCRQRGLVYCETSLLESYGQALRHLHAVGRQRANAAARSTA